MPLYLERYVRPFGCVGKDVPAVHRTRVACVSGSFNDVSLVEAIRLCRPDSHLPLFDRPWVLRVLVDPTAP